KAEPVPLRTSKVEQNLALVRKLGFTGECPQGRLPLREKDRAWARFLVSSLEGSGPVIAVHPADSRFEDIKRWPAASVRSPIDLHREKLDARVIITWGPGERGVAEAVGRQTVLPEEISLPRMAALLEAVDLLVAADTGVLPMAGILGTRTVALYGPKDPL